MSSCTLLHTTVIADTHFQNGLPDRPRSLTAHSRICGPALSFASLMRAPHPIFFHPRPFRRFSCSPPWSPLCPYSPFQLADVSPRNDTIPLYPKTLFQSLSSLILWIIHGIEVRLASHQMPDPDVVNSRVLPERIVLLQQHAAPWFRGNPRVPPQPPSHPPCLFPRLKNYAAAHLCPAPPHRKCATSVSSGGPSARCPSPTPKVKGAVRSPAPRARRQGSGRCGTGPSHRRGSEWDTRSRQSYPAELKETRDGSEITAGGRKERRRMENEGPSSAYQPLVT